MAIGHLGKLLSQLEFIQHILKAAVSVLSFFFEFSVFFVLEMKPYREGLKEHVTYCPLDQC